MKYDFDVRGNTRHEAVGKIGSQKGIDSRAQQAINAAVESFAPADQPLRIQARGDDQTLQFSLQSGTAVRGAAPAGATSAPEDPTRQHR